jgi:DNA-binding NarL/FixJ family response regulator
MTDREPPGTPGSAGTPFPTADPPLVGREHAIGRLTALLAQATADGGALLLTGDPGVGKTALLDVAQQLAADAGARVIRIAGAEFEADIAYAGLNQVLQPLADRIGTLTQDYQSALTVALGLGGGPPPDQLMVGNAVLALLRQAAAVRPLVLIVDDLGWLDKASATVLAFVARRLADSRIGLIGASRTEMAGSFEHAGLPALDVAPLDENAAAELVRSRFPDLARAVRERLLYEAEGNPLALLELPAALSDAQRSSAATLPPTLPLSRRLHAVFTSRVRALPTPTRRVLLLAALDPTGSLDLIRAAAGPADLADLAPAEQSRLVEIHGQVTFRHPLTRAAVVAESTSEERRQAHQALAGMLAGRPEHRAWHLAEAVVGPDDEVAGLLEESAHRIRGRGDVIGAVRALVRAAELSTPGAGRSRRLAQAALIAATVTGELPNASDLLVRAREADPDHGSLPAATATGASLLFWRGEVDAAHGLLATAIETWATRSGVTAAELADALVHLHMVCWFGARAALWERLDAIAARLGENVPDMVKLWLSAFADPARVTPQVLAEVDAAVGRLRDESDPTTVTRVGMAAAFTDRLAGMREPLWRQVSGDAVSAAVTASFQLCLDDFVIGRWDEAEQLAKDGIRICDSRGYQLPGQSLRYARAIVAAVRGEEEVARELSSGLARWAAATGAGQFEYYSRHVNTLLAIGRGDFDAAYRHACSISPAGVLRFRVPVALRVPMDLVESATRTGRQAEAAAHVAALRDGQIAAISPRLALLAAGATAMAAADHEMVEAFERALATPGADRYPFDLARVALAYGERLRRAKAGAAARAPLYAALEAFERLGAQPWAARAGDELRAIGVRKAARLVAGDTALTVQELQIARLAAEGLSNREIAQRMFLSHRTVGTHLYRIFPKLGITSRAALRDALSRLRDPPSESAGQGT